VTLLPPEVVQLSERHRCRLVMCRCCWWRWQQCLSDSAAGAAEAAAVSVEDEQAAGQVAVGAAADQRRVTMLAHRHYIAECACFRLGFACAAAHK
jgi:hypothetical protein